MNDVYHIDTHRSLLGGLAILVMLLLVSLHPVFGFSSHSKSSSNDMTPSGSKSSTSATTPQTPSIKTIASKAVITCINSTIKNALIDALINRPLVNVNSSIRTHFRRIESKLSGPTDFLIGRQRLYFVRN